MSFRAPTIDQFKLGASSSETVDLPAFSPHTIWYFWYWPLVDQLLVCISSFLIKLVKPSHGVK